MTFLRNPCVLASLLVASALAGACSVSTDNPPPATVVVSDGTLTVDWTIDGGKDPNQCAESTSASIQIDVTAAGGASAGTFTQACDAFATTITLPPGDYTATAELVDSNGNARTTSVPIAPFTIDSGVDFVAPIDFPASSFF